jgi:flagellin-like hook-associated protein FlgL
MTTQLQSFKKQESDLTTELTSGKAVATLQDDPSLANTVLNSQVDREQLVQQNANASLATNTAQAGIDDLSYINDELDLAQTEAESGQTDSSVSTNIDSIINEVLATANGKYGDDYLFAGSASGSTTAPFSYDSTSGQYVYNGSGDGRQMEVSDGVTVTPFTSDSDNQAIVSALNSLLSLRDAIASSDTDAISTATAALSTAQDTLTDASSSLGTTQSRIDLITTRNSNRYTNLDSAEESATNSDENEVTAKLLAAQNAYSAALQGTSMLLDESLLDYL